MYMKHKQNIDVVEKYAEYYYRKRIKFILNVAAQLRWKRWKNIGWK